MANTIINGKRYDTEDATIIIDADKFSRVDRLYRSEAGAYYIYSTLGTGGLFDDMTEQHKATIKAFDVAAQYGVDHETRRKAAAESDRLSRLLYLYTRQDGFTPLSEADAKILGEKHLTADEYETVFGTAEMA